MKKIICFLIGWIIPIGVLAQEVNFTTQQIPSQATFAQPFDVHFELAHTPGYTVQLNPESIPASFSLAHEKKEALSPGTVSYDLTFLPFSLGVSTFTAVNFQLLDSQSNILAQTNSDEKKIQVQPVQFFKDKTMRDIRPPYIPVNWIWWILCGCVLILIAYLIRRFWLSTRADRSAAIEVAQDSRPADEIALSKIQFLLQSGLWEKKEYKLFYIELGEILREYFWRRFQLDVSADTSVELLRRVRQNPTLSPFSQLLRDYLNSADLVKFAKVAPSQKTMQQDVSAVTTVVRKTTPATPQQEEP